MARRKKKIKPATSDKIHYIDNEQELFDWAMATAAKLSPQLRETFYEATEPKEIVALAKEYGVADQKALQKAAYILAAGAQSGFFVVKEEVNEERFQQHMYGWYLPRMEMLHQRSTDWFKYHLSMEAPDEVEKLAEMGWNGLTEYIGSAGNIAHFNLYGMDGSIIATVNFDPSKKTFEIFFV